MTNEQVVVLAVWSLTGGVRAADVEDVAVKADALAPDRFRWRKYKDQINIRKIANALLDAKKRDLVRSKSALEWTLTTAGVSEAKNLEVQVGQVAARAPLSAQERAWRKNERVRLLSEPAYLRHRSGEPPTARELLSFFRLDAYVTGHARQDRIDRLLRVFDEDIDLGPVIADFAQRIGA